MNIRCNISRRTSQSEIADCKRDIKAILQPHGSDQCIIQTLNSRNFRRRRGNSLSCDELGDIHVNEKRDCYPYII